MPPPSISITTPVAGATYAPGQVVDAAYACTPAAGTTLASCTGAVANGAAINTNTTGTHKFTVTSQAKGSAVATRTVMYTVSGAPTITKAKIDRRHHRATFKFKATGATGFKCALVKRLKSKHGKKKPEPHFKSCKSPKTYKQLKRGKYAFEVRAVFATGVGPEATRSFKI